MDFPALAEIKKRRVKEPSYNVVRKIFQAIYGCKPSASAAPVISAKDIMNPRVVSVHPHDMVAIAWKKMKEKNYSQLPVIDNARIVGGLSIESMPVGEEEISALLGRKVEEVMTDPFPTVGGDTAIGTVSSLLRSEPAVLVTDRGKVIGIVTKHEVLEKALSKE